MLSELYIIIGTEKVSELWLPRNPLIRIEIWMKRNPKRASELFYTRNPKVLSELWLKRNRKEKSETNGLKKPSKAKLAKKQ
jgi:hypothetical protein